MGTYIGMFEGTSEIRTADGVLLMTPLKRTTRLDPEDRPLAQAAEREGSVALVRGELADGILFEAEVIEILPPVASGILRNLLSDGILTHRQLQHRSELAIRQLAGEPESLLETVTETTRPRCALVVGHRPGARGTSNPARGIMEFDFNDSLAPQIAQRVTKTEVVIVHRDDLPDGYSRLPAKINVVKPDFIISLHCNGFSKASANGTETLVWHRSTKGKEVARILQDQLLTSLELRDRGLKLIGVNQRGALVLQHTVAPCVIAEPFFMTSENDMQQAIDRRESLIQAYASAIDEISTNLFELP